LSDGAIGSNLPIIQPHRGAWTRQAMIAVSDLATPSNDDVDRNLALLAYGLLFFAVFFAGAPALIGVAIAYARKGQTARLIRSHHRYQIFIFWVGVALTLLAALSGLAAVLTVLGEMIASATHTHSRMHETFTVGLPYLGPAVVAFSTAAISLGVLAGLWLMAMSAYGFVRLASHRAISQTAR
jgi:uncharacterized membrane protein